MSRPSANTLDVRKPARELLSLFRFRHVLLIGTPSTYASPPPTAADHYSGIDTSHYLTSSTLRRPPLYGDQDFEPNHGLLLIAGLLINKGISCACLELNIYAKLYREGLVDMDTVSVVVRGLQQIRPQIVGISSMTPNLPLAKQLSHLVRDQRPESFIVLGGMATCDVSSCFRDSCFDVVVEGEGEGLFVQLAREVISGNAPPRMPGLHYSGAFSAQAPNSPASNDEYRYELSLGLPAYETLPRELPLIPRVFLSRGCGNGCDFCSPAAFFHGKVRTRAPRAVVDEIIQLHSRFVFDWFLIGDLTLHINSKPVREFLQRLGNLRIKPWWAQTLLSFISEQNATLLSRAGCRQLAVGIEDFTITDKAVARKHGGKTRGARNLSILKAHGIAVQCYWMFGLPGETFRTSLTKINDMCELIRKKLVDTVHISYYVPYPNTRVATSGGIDVISNDFAGAVGAQSQYYANVPMHRTPDLTEKEILLLTQLAMACAANEFASETRDEL